MSIAYLSLGSNLGERDIFIKRAMDMMQDKGIAILKKSSIIETLPVGGPPQGKYLNLVLKIQTSFSLEELFFVTSAVEQHLGRLRKIRNGPRVIDIDILLYDDVKLISKSLIVPHPRMFDRDFVMYPLKEVDPQLCASFAM